MKIKMNFDLLDTIRDFYPLHRFNWNGLEEGIYYLYVATLDGKHYALKHNNVWYHFYCRRSKNAIHEICEERLVVSLFLYPGAEVKTNFLQERLKEIEFYLKEGCNFYQITEGGDEHNNESYQKIKNDPDFIHEVLLYFKEFDFIKR